MTCAPAACDVREPRAIRSGSRSGANNPSALHRLFGVSSAPRAPRWPSRSAARPRSDGGRRERTHVVHSYGMRESSRSSPSAPGESHSSSAQRWAGRRRAAVQRRLQRRQRRELYRHRARAPAGPCGGLVRRGREKVTVEFDARGLIGPFASSLNEAGQSAGARDIRTAQRT